jgi:NAD(P)-dependent dehydrogenase (short-subunit alcohol dehydrogenase family)
MRQQGSGVMVNLISASRVGRVYKGHTAYLASQAGVMGLTRVAAHELAPYHIRVNSVFRGPKDIDLIPPQDWDATIFHHWQAMLLNVSQGEYHDLVSMVLFLCSDASSLTGQVIPVDPGVS